MNTKTLLICGALAIGGYLLYRFTKATAASLGNNAATYTGSTSADSSTDEVDSQLIAFANTIGNVLQQPSGGMPTG